MPHFTLDKRTRVCYNTYAKKHRHFGLVAQLGERCVRNAEVMGSSPTRSTRKNLIRTG